MSGLAWVIAHGPGWAAAHAAFGLALAVAATWPAYSSLRAIGRGWPLTVNSYIMLA